MSQLPRRGGVKSVVVPKLVPPPTPADLHDPDSILVGMFNTMSKLDKDDLAYANKFCPFVHIIDKRAVPDHCRPAKRVQAPTRSWKKLGSAAKEIHDDETKVEFMKQWSLIASAYPRTFMEVYVCSNLDSLDALLTDFLSYVLMRLALPSMRDMKPAQVHSVYNSMTLVSSTNLVGQQYFKYGQRVLTLDMYCRCPSLAPCGCFHELSKLSLIHI